MASFELFQKHLVYCQKEQQHLILLSLSKKMSFAKVNGKYGFLVSTEEHNK
ncbi:hypothetical protein B4168_1389 [Anoxybacillus flavithermus]|nr:hypothetical protein B4168_1389 [Anoxybacillus flavithermus]OAO84046.1 hypothetical protein GT23_3581 [Parageobacillus thermoglucosidasius]